MTLRAALLFLPVFPASLAAAQMPCQNRIVRGTVVDGTEALVPDAELTVNGTRGVRSKQDGSFVLPCVTSAKLQLHVHRDGFQDLDLELKVSAAGAPLRIVLRPASVEQSIEVGAEDNVEGAGSDASSMVLAGDRLNTLAEDPDDLLHELQQLASLAGGKPADTTIAIDGFQDSTSLPPKAAIAYIKINPDRYSAEYAQAPFSGGRVEIYTKPGQKNFHGAFAVSESSAWMNASNPFAVQGVPVGKSRYAAELSGPIRGHGNAFFLSVEHRQIRDSAVVNAVGLDSTGNQTLLLDNIPTPQSLFTASARVDWQLGDKHSLYFSYSSYVNAKKIRALAARSWRRVPTIAGLTSRWPEERWSAP